MSERKIKEALDQIRADEDLKASTRAYLAQKTGGYAPPGRRVRAPRLLWAAACLVLVLAGGGWAFFTPTAAISVDINPSMELGINRFDRVISGSGYNQEGQALADSLDIKYLDYQRAIALLLENQEVAALMEADGVLTVTVVGSDGSQCARMLSHLQGCAAGHGNMYCYAADSSQVEAAHALGLSYGKYRAFLEWQALDPAVEPEQVQGMSMRQIRDRIQALSSGESAAKGMDGQEGGHHGRGGGHGQGWGHRGGQDALRQQDQAF